MDFTGQRVLITGGAGFVGSALARHLLDAGAEVVCADVAPFERLAALEGHERLSFVHCDVRDAARVSELVSGVDRVAHLAGVVGVHKYIETPELVVDVTVMGGRNVLAACRDHGKPVVLASTSEVYGANPFPLSEATSARLYGPVYKQRWAYATSKGTVDHLAFAFGKLGVHFGIVRYFNVYGPELDAPGEGRVLSTFLGRMQKGEPLQLVDGGHAVRCYCYVDDAVAATAEFLGRLGPEDPVTGKVINIGRKDPLSVRELADVVIRLADYKPGTIEVEGTKHFGEGFEDIPCRVPDLSRMHALLETRANTPLEVGVARVLERWGLLATEPTPSEPKPIANIRPAVEPNFELALELADVLASGHLTNHGPRAKKLEAAWSERIGAPALVVSNGAAALEVAFMALDTKAGFAVLPSFTYVATLNAVVRAGLFPLFCDVDDETWTLCPKALAKLKNENGELIRAVVPVNAFGVPPDLAGIRAVVGAGVPIVYDAAHGVGTTVDGAAYDDAATVTTYSFHATKVLPAGEGGAIATTNDALLAKMERVRNHGLLPGDTQWQAGTNAKLSELHAAVALHSLARLDDVLGRRRDYAARMRTAFEALGSDALRVQRIPDGVETSGQNMVVRFPWLTAERRDEVIGALAESGVHARAYFSPMLHTLDHGGPDVELPVTDAIDAQALCLPLHSRMSDDEVTRIIDAVSAVARKR